MKIPTNECDTLEYLKASEEMICFKDYNIELLDTPQSLEAYLQNAENELTEFAMNSRFTKASAPSVKENLVDFLCECNYLAFKMSGSILFVYDREKEFISASLICPEMIFRENEIESFMKICSLACHFEFIPTGTKEDGFSVLEVIFELSQNSATLANIIESLKEYF